MGPYLGGVLGELVDCVVLLVVVSVLDFLPWPFFFVVVSVELFDVVFEVFVSPVELVLAVEVLLSVELLLFLCFLPVSVVF